MIPQAAARRHPSRRRLRPVTLVLSVVLAALSAAALAAAAGKAPARVTLSFRISHYLCYSAKSSATFNRRTVVLVDQFRQSRQTIVTSVATLCNPARKAGSTIVDRRAHLVCYRTKSAKPFTTRRVVVSNQFGKVQLSVAKPNSLCLPSAKSLDLTRTSLPIPTTIAHFQCYPVKLLTTTRGGRFTVVDQFGRGLYAVTTPFALCNPARKNGSSVPNTRDHLVCYLVDPLQTPVQRKVVVYNQFGAQRLDVFEATRLCLPSLKRELAP